MRLHVYDPQTTLCPANTELFDSSSITYAPSYPSGSLLYFRAYWLRLRLPPASAGDNPVSRHDSADYPHREQHPAAFVGTLCQPFPPLPEDNQLPHPETCIVSADRATYRSLTPQCLQIVAISSACFPGLIGIIGPFMISMILCVRSVLCADLKHLPAGDENPLLYHLPDF